MDFDPLIVLGGLSCNITLQSTGRGTLQFTNPALLLFASPRERTVRVQLFGRYSHLDPVVQKLEVALWNGPSVTLRGEIIARNKEDNTIEIKLDGDDLPVWTEWLLGRR